jgi:site-specific DNA recombinase
MKPRARCSAKPTEAVSYTRVSTAAQVKDGISLDQQAERIRAWAASQGLALVGEFTDEGLSGTTTERPGFQAAVDLAGRRGAVLAVYSLSRLSRSTRAILELVEVLERKGAGLASLSETLDTSSPSGRMMLRMLSSVAEFQADETRERVRAALGHKRSRGERVSRFAPFGFRHEEGRTVEDQAEQEAISTLRSWRAAGATFRELVDRANREGLPCRGRGWRLATIHRALAEK